ncbi:hypothetical protein DM02DRAFT_659174 [Periconia macrospinosa]|uniref:Uncharacterized protein n=1 Tax=Periconia macrospinosa TaxID=97972 RepID=A0A2V1DFX0_9PLEO|nr:hypothetical protein DM02DRAFT_659174 [Periconia macrospinosa]
MPNFPGTMSNPIIILDSDGEDNTPPPSPRDGRSSATMTNGEVVENDEDVTLVGDPEDVTLVDAEDAAVEDDSEDIDDQSEPTPGAFLVSVRPEGTYLICGTRTYLVYVRPEGEYPVRGPLGNYMSFHHNHDDTDEEMIVDAESDQGAEAS